MTYAIHNLHTRAVQIDSAGTYTLNGTYRTPCGTPLYTSDTMEEAEAWRMERLREVGRGL